MFVNRLRRFIKNINFYEVSARDQLARLHMPYDKMAANEFSYAHYYKVATEQWLNERIEVHVQQKGLSQIIDGRLYSLLDNAHTRGIIPDEKALQEALTIPMQELLSAKGFVLVQLVVTHHVSWLQSYAKVPHEQQVVKGTQDTITEIAQYITDYIMKSEPEEFSKNEIQQLLACLYTAENPKGLLNADKLCLRVLLHWFVNTYADVPSIWQEAYLATLREDLLQQADILRQHSIIITAPRQAAIILGKIDYIADNTMAQQLRDCIKKDHFSFQEVPMFEFDEGKKMLALIDELLAAERKILKIESGFGKDRI